MSQQKRKRKRSSSCQFSQQLDKLLKLTERAGYNKGFHDGAAYAMKEFHRQLTRKVSSA